MAVKVIKIFEIVNFRGMEIPQCEKQGYVSQISGKFE